MNRMKTPEGRGVRLELLQPWMALPVGSLVEVTMGEAELLVGRRFAKAVEEAEEEPAEEPEDSSADSPAPALARPPIDRSGPTGPPSQAALASSASQSPLRRFSVRQSVRQ